VSHSRKSAAQRAKSLERLKAFRERAPHVPVSREQDAPAPRVPVSDNRDAPRVTVSGNCHAPAARATPYKSPEREAWENAYSARPITLESTQWREDERYPRFLLETCSGGNRLSVSRNRPNPTDI
jgi:hypothetical protein